MNDNFYSAEKSKLLNGMFVNWANKGRLIKKWNAQKWHWFLNYYHKVEVVEITLKGQTSLRVSLRLGSKRSESYHPQNSAPSFYPDNILFYHSAYFALVPVHSLYTWSSYIQYLIVFSVSMFTISDINCLKGDVFVCFG